MASVYGNSIEQKASVIYNGINFEKLDAINPSPSDFSENSPTIIYYGRLYWRKGVYQFLCAMLRLKSSFPKIRAKIFGQGPMAKRMKQDMPNTIKVIGYVEGHGSTPESLRKKKFFLEGYEKESGKQKQTTKPKIIY
jgi:glycosyltransferase involved in cell wall biosynthesis